MFSCENKLFQQIGDVFWVHSLVLLQQTFFGSLQEVTVSNFCL